MPDPEFKCGLAVWAGLRYVAAPPGKSFDVLGAAVMGGRVLMKYRVLDSRVEGQCADAGAYTAEEFSRQCDTGFVLNAGTPAAGGVAPPDAWSPPPIDWQVRGFAAGCDVAAVRSAAAARGYSDPETTRYAGGPIAEFTARAFATSFDRAAAHLAGRRSYSAEDLHEAYHLLAFGWAACEAVAQYRELLGRVLDETGGPDNPGLSSDLTAAVRDALAAGERPAAAITAEAAQAVAPSVIGIAPVPESER